MLFQLTSAGRALINTDPTGTKVTRVDFGSGYGYVPANDPVGLQGSVVYSSVSIFDPMIVDSNTIRYSVYLPSAMGPFTFGEIAAYAGAVLLGVGAATDLITKTSGAFGNEYRIDFFVDLSSGQSFASTEVVSSLTKDYFPRVATPDQLKAPAFDSNNAYVIYGNGPNNSAYMAYSDPSGKWSFSDKPRTWFTGAVTNVSALGLQSANLVGQSYPGAPTDLIIQFVDGAQRGYCRQLTGFTDAGAVTWQSNMTVLPLVGDTFVIVGPSVGSNFTGAHSSLSGVQGGLSTTEQYHLTNTQLQHVEYPRLTVQDIVTPTYAVQDSDNGSYNDIAADTTITVDSALFTAFPNGGAVFFRYLNCALTIQGINTTILSPVNVVNIPTGTGIVALVKKGPLAWDVVSSVVVLPSIDGNVRHQFTGPTSPANLDFVPRYSIQSGSGLADIASSRLLLTDTGGVLLYPGDTTQAINWNAPAQLFIGIDAYPVSNSTNTGYANDSTAYLLSLNISGTLINLSVTGSLAQTVGALISQVQPQIDSVLGAGRAHLELIPDYGLMLVATTGAGSSIQVLSGNLFSALQSVVAGSEVSVNAPTISVDPTSTYLNTFDAVSGFYGPSNLLPKTTGLHSVVMGRGNSAPTAASSAIGGNYNIANGVHATVIGGSINRINGAQESVIVGGIGNSVFQNPGAAYAPPSNSAILGGELNTIQSTDSSNIATLSSVIASRKSNAKSYNVGIFNSDTVSASGPKSSVLASTNCVLASSVISLIGGQSVTTDSASSYLSLDSVSGITITNSSKVKVSNSTNLTVLGQNSVAVIGVNDLGIVKNSSVFYPPNAGKVAAGLALKPGSNFIINSSAFGSGTSVVLTTDGQALGATGITTNNAFRMGANENWTFSSIISANNVGGDSKGWMVKGVLSMLGGIIQIVSCDIEIVGGTAGSANWSLDFVVDPTTRDICYFTINTLNIGGLAVDVLTMSAITTVAVTNRSLSV